jgi:YVTN family beta-propeller protein
VWVANFGGHSVSQIDPKTNAVEATIKVRGNPNTIVGRGSDVWAGDQDGAVVRIDAKSNSIVARTEVVFGLTGMAISGNSLRVADMITVVLLRIDLGSNALEAAWRLAKVP